MSRTEHVKRLILTAEQIALVEKIRGDVKSVGDDEYANGVIDALAFVWAGMPEDAYDLYRGMMSQFADLMKKVEEYQDEDFD